MAPLCRVDRGRQRRLWNSEANVLMGRNNKQTEAMTLLYISHFIGIYRVKLAYDKRIEKAQRKPGGFNNVRVICGQRKK